MIISRPENELYILTFFFKEIKDQENSKQNKIFTIFIFKKNQEIIMNDNLSTINSYYKTNRIL